MVESLAPAWAAVSVGAPGWSAVRMAVEAAVEAAAVLEAVEAAVQAAWASPNGRGSLPSALPVKQASVKLRYGIEAATAADGLSYINREEPNYVVSVTGLPGRMAGFMQRGRGGGGFGGGRGGRAGGMGKPQMTAVVRWFSALPVKQASVKLRYGIEAATAADGLSYINREEPNYVVSVTGLPGRMAGFMQRTPDRIKENTSLHRKGKEPILPADLQITTQMEETDLYFVFPKTDPITLDDKDVEFLMKTERMEIKRKFKLKKMVFDGELSL